MRVIAPALAIAAFGASFVTRNARENETVLLLLESAVLSQVGALVGQTILASERPQDESVRLFHYRGHGVSGDATLAASLIMPLHRQYLRVTPDDNTGTRMWKWAATTLLFAGATLSAYQRLDSDGHWAPDAFLGIMTGLGVGQILCEAHDKAGQEKEKASKQPRITFGVMPGVVTLNIRF